MIRNISLLRIIGAGAMFSVASAALIFDPADADFSAGVDPILLGTGNGNAQTTQRWQFGDDFSLNSETALRNESNDRVRAMAYVFDNSVNPWTGEVDLQFTWSDRTSLGFRVAFYGYDDLDAGIISLSSGRNDAALTQIADEGRARTAVGTNEVFIGPDYDNAFTKLAHTNAEFGASGTFTSTVDLGVTPYDRVAMIVWTEGRNQVRFDNFSIIPEPSSLAMLGIAAVALIFVRRRRKE